MRTTATLTAIILWAVTQLECGADEVVFPTGDARRSMGNLRPSQPGRRAPPAAGRGKPAAAQQRRPDRQDLQARPRYHPGPHRVGRRYLYIYYPFGLGYVSPLFPYYYDPYYVPPLYIPAEELYGPQAVGRFFGWDNRNLRQPNINVIIPPAKPDEPAEEPNEKEPGLRGTNQRSLELGWKFIGFGDAHFGNQRYDEAYRRYRTAAKAAPRLAEAHFRQGYALAAMGGYDTSVKAIKRGLELDPHWPASNFDNSQLYGENRAARTAHLEAIAEAAERQPHNSNLLFLLGVLLYFDGERERANVFLQRAGQLAGGNDAHIKAFLRPQE